MVEKENPVDFKSEPVKRVEAENKPEIVDNRFELEEDARFKVENVKGSSDAYDAWNFQVRAWIPAGEGEETHVKRFKIGMLKGSFTEEGFAEEVREKYRKILRDSDSFESFDASMQREESDVEAVEGEVFKV